MKHNFKASLFSLICVAFSLNISVAASQTPPHVTIPKATVGPFLKQYCYKCHGEKRQRGDLRLDTLDWVIKDNGNAQQWQDVLDAMNAGDMPPEEETQPSDILHSRITGTLTKGLAAASKQLASKGGKNPIRRLNEREYLQSVKHLFGLNVHESLIPDDIRGEHFDTSGDDQYIDGPLINQFLEVGNQIVREAFQWSAKPYGKPKTTRKEGESFYSKKRQRNPSLPKSDKGFYIYGGNRHIQSVGITLGPDPRANYKVRVHAGIYDNAVANRHFLTLAKGSAIRGQRTPKLGVMKITGTLDQPSTAETIIPRTALSLTTTPNINIKEVLPNEITNPARWFPIYLNHIGGKRDRPNTWIDWVELEGPFYDSKQNVFGELISKNGKNLGSKEKARELIEAFAFEAFRRVQPSSEYINKLHAYFQALSKSGKKYEDAMSETLSLVLVSPSFLYLEERPSSNVSRVLNARTFAVRLAHFLWSSPPDEELYALAKSGKILEPATLKQQIDRMLTDHKATSFYEGFMEQWIEVDRFLDITIDWQNHLTFNTGVRASAAREPIEFFKTLVKENLDVDHLIDSSFIVVDAILAQFYEIPGKHDFEGFKKLKIPANHPRGGIITQSAFLTMGSNGTRPSPVIRGTMILEKLLNSPPPQPPPNVPEIESATDKPISNRELVELHRKQKACASCHDKIDPIGFGLENFNTVGLWRDHEMVDGEKRPINSTGILISGVKFHNLPELQKLIKSQEHKLAQNLVETMTSYAIGRQIEFSDKANVASVVQRVRAEKYGIRDIIFHVANSKTFRSK